MRNIKNFLVLFFSLTALVVTGVGVCLALQSDLFLVRVVEVNHLAENAPVDAQTISDLAAISIGKSNLFKINLHEIETRIRSNPWIKDALLTVRLPQTVQIEVKFKDPVALIQLAQGKIAYVDGDGDVFGQLRLDAFADLPILTTGLGSGERKPAEGAVGRADRTDRVDRIKGAIKVVQAWQNRRGESIREAGSGDDEMQISTVSWDPDQGYRAIISYPLNYSPKAKAERGSQPGEKKKYRARTTVLFGQEIDDDLGLRLARLDRVLGYLGSKGIAAKQVWAEVNKKIIVKTARSS